MKPLRLHSRSLRAWKRCVRLGMELLEPRLPLALDVPALSSLPGANHTIYLDFDGHVTQGTSWNSAYSVASINSPAYSTDFNSSSFSAAELANIQNSWKRVAEDFAPFHVNVTTVAPSTADLIKSGSGDTRWGVRVVITKDVAFNCGCGGIAYINSFNWGSDTPVFVFNSSLVGVAEAISHEAGHALGLSHDGTATSSYYSGHGSGATSWSAIMGVGYYVSVSQWDKGDYYGSNNTGSKANYSKGPDDLKVITSYNGFGYRADDHADTNTGSTPLGINGASVSGGGIIERTTDIDVFQFTTGAGNVSLNINSIGTGANLDIKADLFDSNGQLLASSNPAGALNASFNLTLPGGLYFLRVDGSGVGNPAVQPPTGYSDYASLGQYSISGSIVSTTSDVFSIAAMDASRSEGNSGATTFTFKVTRSGNMSGTSTVSWSVAGSGAAPANDADFMSLLSGELQFGPNVSSQIVTVDVEGDIVPEPNEGFVVTLSNASAGTSIGQSEAGGMIQNDDVPPAKPVLAISATDASKNEGTGADPTAFLFTITRSGDTSAESKVKYTVSGTSSRKASSSDFVRGFPKNVVVTFAPGQVTAEIRVEVIADTSGESNEKFKVKLSSPVNATLQNSSATGTILNDDPTAAQQGAGVSEADTGLDTHEGAELIAVADPLWMFMPAEMLTAEQLAVPVITRINGVAYTGDLHEHEYDWEHDELDFDHGDQVSFELLAFPVDRVPLLALDKGLRQEESPFWQRANEPITGPMRSILSERVMCETQDWTSWDWDQADFGSEDEGSQHRAGDSPDWELLSDLDRWCRECL